MSPSKGSRKGRRAPRGWGPPQKRINWPAVVLWFCAAIAIVLYITSAPSEISTLSSYEGPMRVEHWRNGSTVIVGSEPKPIEVQLDEVRAATGRPDGGGVDIFMSSDQRDLRPIVVVMNSSLVNTRCVPFIHS